ncbi:hypothetical protein AA0472_0365 [Acetobacter estunensis NRIC 0472]|uniref:Uncharacterized protein n=1 Tax=Acetobacter estunensis TaxID=104097 RepID=A0A967B8H8_9PROT|nr:hypothetical protein [Acetobacter estunensis]NHO54304.1 hypothetical protein [Acetobacter estunensis]GBQ21173.1 hypothetical protein AA0472_0365 [Acetobacter estunensis NRIC 0472]
MSAFSRLWHRAPLWRLSFFGMIAFSGLTVLYPPHWLLKLYPPLNKLAHHVAAPPADETTGPPSGDTGKGAPTGGDSVQAAAPPIDATLTDILPFAGHQLPLPAGVWHPVLTDQAGPHGEINSNVLVRTDRGVVTGVIIARSTNASISATEADNIAAPCHDDRYTFRRQLAAPPGSAQCVATDVVYVDHDEVSAASDVNWAFRRLKVLGFPMPFVLAQALWVHMVRATDGGINFEAVSIALSPAEPGSAKLNTTPADWTPQGIGQSPFAGRFMNSVNNWILSWAPVLLAGHEGRLQPMADGQLRPGAVDPAWHGSAGRIP